MKQKWFPALWMLTALLLTACGSGGGAGPEEITFPYSIPNAPLEIQSVVSYDGLYLEDGSDTEITGVSAILLKNTGKQCVEYATVQMTGAQNTQTFTASGLGPGETVLVQEAGKTEALSQEYDAITAEVALTDRFERSEDLLEVTETEDGSLNVYNRTEEELPCVRIFYKFYQSENETYLGGITYVSKLEHLAPGESTKIRPSHYQAGQSQVIMVKVYDEGTE